MATRVTYRQVTLEPEHVADRINQERLLAAREAAGLDVPDHELDVSLVQSSCIIAGVEPGQCQCVGATYIGGANPDAGRWLFDLVIYESVTESSDDHSAQ